MDRVGLVGRFRGRDDRGIGDQREMNSGIWYKVGLELVQVDVERAVEPKRRRD